MFTIIKNKYIRCLLGIFVFMFITLSAYKSFASVCFLPTGSCGEENETVGTSDDFGYWCEEDDPDCYNGCDSGWSTSCPDGNVCEKSNQNGVTCYRTIECASGWLTECPTGNVCEKSNQNGVTCYKVKTEECPSGWLTECPTGNVCEESEGCYKVTGCDEDNGYYTDCPEGKTCKESTVNGCVVIDNTPVDVCVASSGYYDTRDECTSANSGKACKESGECWIVDNSGEDNGTDDTNECPENYICVRPKFYCNGGLCSDEEWDDLVEYFGELNNNCDDLEEFISGEKETWCPKINNLEIKNECENSYDEQTTNLINSCEKSKSSRMMMDFSCSKEDGYGISWFDAIDKNKRDASIKFLKDRCSNTDEIKIQLYHSTFNDEKWEMTGDYDLIQYFPKDNQFQAYPDIDFTVERFGKYENIIDYETAFCNRENPTKISVIATCNKFTEINSYAISKGVDGDSSYLPLFSDLTAIDDKGCLDQLQLRYVNNGWQTLDSYLTFRIYEFNDKYVINTENGWTDIHGDKVEIGSELPNETDKFLYQFMQDENTGATIPSCTKYEVTIKPLDIRIIDSSDIYQLYRSFVLKDNMESTDISKKNTTLSTNDHIILDKYNDNSELVVYPVIDYDYRMYAMINSDENASAFLHTVTINNPFIPNGSELNSTNVAFNYSQIRTPDFDSPLMFLNFGPVRVDFTQQGTNCGTYVMPIDRQKIRTKALSSIGGNMNSLIKNYEYNAGSAYLKPIYDYLPVDSNYSDQCKNPYEIKSHLIISNDHVDYLTYDENIYGDYYPRTSYVYAEYEPSYFCDVIVSPEFTSTPGYDGICENRTDAEMGRILAFCPEDRISGLDANGIYHRYSGYNCINSGTSSEDTSVSNFE